MYIALHSGIEIEPSNKSLWSALRSAEEAYETDRVARHAAAAIERAQEDHRKQLRESGKNRPSAVPVVQVEKQAPIKNAAEDLSDFFASVAEVKPETKEPDVVPSPLASNSQPGESAPVPTVPVAEGISLRYEVQIDIDNIDDFIELVLLFPYC